VALGKACEIANKNYWDDSTEVSKLRAYLEHQLLEIPNLRIIGSTRYRLYNTSNLCFPLLKDGTSLFSVIKNQYAVSLGSACNSSNNEPSHVLKAMGIIDQDARNCIRFSFGNKSQKEDVVKLCELILSLY
jgi:cysteine desulfurase